MGHRISSRAQAIALRAHALRARAALSTHALRAHTAISGCARALTLRTRAAVGGCGGQGTVEYVALILLVAGLFATVVVAAGGVKGDGIAHAITEKIKSTIDGVGAKS
jgi:hypothetical protein